MFYQFPSLLTLLTICAFAGSAYAQIEVQLKESAQAQSRQVRLAEIATINSGTENIRQEALGSMVIATIAHMNQPLRIEARKLERILARQQPGLGKIQFTGATAVSVVLPGEELPLDRVAESAKSFLQSTLSQQFKKFSIHEAHIERESLLIPQGPLQLKPHLASALKPARKIEVLVDIHVNDQRVDSVPVKIDIAMTVPMYQLTRSMVTGETPKLDDYKIVEQPIERLTRAAYLLDTKTDLSIVRLRRNIAAGATLYREDIEPAPYIARNQKILAELKMNGILIEKAVLAQTDGQLGQTIKVTNAGDGTEADAKSATFYTAKIIAHDRVEVK